MAELARQLAWIAGIEAFNLVIALALIHVSLQSVANSERLHLRALAAMVRKSR